MHAIENNFSIISGAAKLTFPSFNANTFDLPDSFYKLKPVMRIGICRAYENSPDKLANLFTFINMGVGGVVI